MNEQFSVVPCGRQRLLIATHGSRAPSLAPEEIFIRVSRSAQKFAPQARPDYPVALSWNRNTGKR